VKTLSVKSSLGNLAFDHDSSPVAVAKLHPDRAYLGVPTLFVPPGFGKIGETPVPNVIEPDDPNKVFSAVFGKNRELWTTDLNLK
jgi:hypothetical protein